MDHTAIRRHVDSALAEARPEFGSFFLAKFLDLGITYGEDEQTCTVRLPASPMLSNPQGSVHGGVLTTVMDISMGHLSHHFLSTAVTLEMNTRFFRPVHGDCRAIGRFLQTGRKIVHMESHLYDTEDQLCALAVGSWHRITKSR